MKIKDTTDIAQVMTAYSVTNDPCLRYQRVLFSNNLINHNRHSRVDHGKEKQNIFKCLINDLSCATISFSLIYQFAHKKMDRNIPFPMRVKPLPRRGTTSIQIQLIYLINPIFEKTN